MTDVGFEFSSNNELKTFQTDQFSISWGDDVSENGDLQLFNHSVFASFTNDMKKDRC